MIALRHRKYGKIIPFCAAGGEEQLLRTAPKGVGNLTSGVLDRFFCVQAQLMHCGGVPPRGSQSLHDCGNGLRTGLGCGGVIKIDFQ